ncbi:hypothetical protein FOZ63_032038, partial [Perkinsus olseni]
MARRRLAPLTLDIVNNYVPMTLDGHIVNLYLDSATSEWLVMSGEAYEAEHGEGACRELASGCYFCPPTSPCEDLHQRIRTPVYYCDGDSLEYVKHAGTLSIGGMNVSGLKFGLIVNYTSSVSKLPPSGMLGLALGPYGSSMLEQLRMRDVIGEVSATIAGTDIGEGITGELLLGHSAESLAKLTPVKFSTHPTYEQRCLTLLRTDMKPVDNRSERSEGDFIVDLVHVLVDTGSSTLDLTRREFEVMLNEMKRRVEQDGGNPSPDPLWIDNRGVVWTSTLFRDYLPILGFHLVDSSGSRPTPIRIYPKHYIRECWSEECVLDLLVDDSDLSCLGHPFFRAYYTYMNLTSMMLYLTPNAARSRPTPKPRAAVEASYTKAEAVYVKDHRTASCAEAAMVLDYQRDISTHSAAARVQAGELPPFRSFPFWKLRGRGVSDSCLVSECTSCSVDAPLVRALRDPELW